MQTSLGLYQEKQPLNFREFSRRLIQTKDLDPDYVYMLAVIKNSGISVEEVVYWIIHKVFIYDTASELKFMHGEINYDDITYGAERRKNKNNTRRQLEAFLNKFKLGDMPDEYNEAREYLTSFDGIGDWASWKFCDLMERVAGFKIDFSKVDFRNAYKFPLKGLLVVNGENDSQLQKLNSDIVYESYMEAMRLQLGDVSELASPPVFDRKINIQEIETCLCKFHSYVGGHYRIGQDTQHLFERLKLEGLEQHQELF